MKDVWTQGKEIPEEARRIQRGQLCSLGEGQQSVSDTKEWGGGGAEELKKSNVLYSAGVVASASHWSKKDNPVKMRNVNVNASPFVYINPSVDPCALMVKVIRTDIFKAPEKEGSSLAKYRHIFHTSDCAVHWVLNGKAHWSGTVTGFCRVSHKLGHGMLRDSHWGIFQPFNSLYHPHWDSVALFPRQEYPIWKNCLEVVKITTTLNGMKLSDLRQSLCDHKKEKKNLSWFKKAKCLKKKIVTLVVRSQKWPP